MDKFVWSKCIMIKNLLYIRTFIISVFNSNSSIYYEVTRDQRPQGNTQDNQNFRSYKIYLIQRCMQGIMFCIAFAFKFLPTICKTLN